MDAKAALVIDRLMIVHEYILENYVTPTREPKVKPPSLRQQVIAVGRPQWHQLVFGRTVRCKICCLTSGHRVATTAFSAACTGPRAGDRHDIRQVNGLYVCYKCGKYSITAAFKKPGLAEDCGGPTGTKKPTKSPQPAASSP